MKEQTTISNTGQLAIRVTSEELDLIVGSLEKTASDFEELPKHPFAANLSKDILFELNQRKELYERLATSLKCQK